MTQPAPSESRMLIDGKLVEARSGRPSTTSTRYRADLGQVADGDKSRHGWRPSVPPGPPSTTAVGRRSALRKSCLMQLQDGARRRQREALRAELVAEVGAPITLTMARNSTLPLGETIPWVVDHVDDFALGARPTRQHHHGRTQLALGLQGTGRRCRGHRAVELSRSKSASPRSLRPGHRQHRRPQTRTRHSIAMPPD